MHIATPILWSDGSKFDKPEPQKERVQNKPLVRYQAYIGHRAWTSSDTLSKRHMIPLALVSESGVWTQILSCWHQEAYHSANEDATAGLDVLCGHTKKQFAVRQRGLYTTNLNIQMKRSRRGTSTGGVQKNHICFFGELFLKNRQNIL